MNTTLSYSKEKEESIRGNSCMKVDKCSRVAFDHK